ncbi:MAG: MBL fold metallo-hydrolase RNA specificity domain-containing protein [Alloalcanivorax xenomutans]
MDNLGGYSAHADQQGLIRFVTSMRKAPSAIRIVHGDDGAKRKLQGELSRLLPQCRILYPCGSQPAGE